MSETETRIPGEISGRTCPKCGGPTVWRKGRYSTFHGCKAYPQCDGKIGAPRGAAAKAAREIGATEKEAEQLEKGAIEAGEVEEAETPAPAQTPAGLRSMGQFGELMWAALAPEVESLAARKAAEIVANSKSGTVKIEWVTDGKPFAQIEGSPHARLNDCLRRVKAGLKNIMLVGPAGSGKTHLARDIATATGARKFAHVGATAGMPEWHLMGRSMPNLQTGASVYQASDFVDCYENGGVFLLDEMDAADANTLLAVNAALANGHLAIPARTDSPVATRHADFIFIGAANTFGNGANRQYVGRNQLDASTLSRFAGAFVVVDYDRDLEQAIVGDARILTRVWAIREKIADLGLRQIVGTRELIAVARLVKSGETLDFALEALTASWTPDERTKAGLGKGA